MIDKKKLINKLKYIIILICLILSIFFLYKTFSKYESTSTSRGNIEVAFYILNEDYQSMNLSLPEFTPRNEPYVCTFSVANNKDGRRTDTRLEYDLSIRTTTNLPLTYELYLNENYNSNNATNIITSNLVEQDSDGTYFRNISTETKSFGFQTNETNTYNLVIYFPIQYRLIQYQDIIESIEVIVTSKQIVE
ncbi:MAG: hypothetical protein Q4G09_02455 [Clostridia bacterium]|nr:hypothetical protein [Clostridia bacterium]